METIYYNGKIITIDREMDKEGVEAVLVQDDKIVYVGSLKEAQAQSKDATLYDLQGKCLMPAFVDPHSHFITSGQLSMCCNLADCNSFDDIKNALNDYISKKTLKPGEAILGFGYDHNFLKEAAQPDKRVLDEVSKDIPILIMHVSLHLACCNSAALKLAGIDENTPALEGGLIQRFEGTNEPTGYVEEAGLSLLQGIIYPHVNMDPSEMYESMQLAYLENGITTCQDGATDESCLAMLYKMADANILKLDVVAYPMVTSNGIELMHNNEKIYQKYYNHIKIGGYKMILDGSPQGRSAWMSKPYLHGEEGYCAYSWMSDEDATNYIRTAVSEKRQILVHCNGDAASEQYLRCYEKVVEELDCEEDLRPVMIHCQTVRNDQLDRMAKLNMIASIFVGHVYYWGDIHCYNFGEERGNRVSPVQDALKRGLHVNFHQDTPVTKPNMLHSIWASVNRITRRGRMIGEFEKCSVYDALRACTIEGAYEYREENIKGSIEIGKQADLIVLDKSPLDVDPMTIKDIQVLETIKDGICVYKKN